MLSSKRQRNSTKDLDSNQLDSSFFEDFDSAGHKICLHLSYFTIFNNTRIQNHPGVLKILRISLDTSNEVSI